MLRWADGMRRAHVVARGLRPPRPPSMCFTTIDILAVGVEAVEVAAASTREHHCDDDHPSDCGQHPVGSPLAKPAAARWHFAHQRSQRAGRRAAIAPGGAPTGHLGKMSKQQPGAAADFGLPKIFFYKRKKSKADGSLPLQAEVS